MIAFNTIMYEKKSEDSDLQLINNNFSVQDNLITVYVAVRHRLIFFLVFC